MTQDETVKDLVIRRFKKANLRPIAVNVRSFPGETIVVVEIDRDYELALNLAEELDEKIEDGFVTIRQKKPKSQKKSRGRTDGVHDKRISNLIELLNARARTSESQPSLRYVLDIEERINLAISERHHLIFGRRGVGKTSLLLEAKRILESEGKYTLWVNIHALRQLDGKEAFLQIASRLCDIGLGAFQSQTVTSGSIRIFEGCRESINNIYKNDKIDSKALAKLVPQLQQAVTRFCLETNQSFYIFLDDVHYLNPNEVPICLDLLHGIARDNPLWLKVAGIQHQTRWFIAQPPTGLQTGHDASIINLDVTLEHPEKAKLFLQNVLQGYVDECDVNPVSAYLGTQAIDRLVLASGGVPRDFLTLCVGSLQTARSRENAKTVGVQDVNNAAGIAAQVKLQELEDDAAATQGQSQELLASLQIIREFLLTERQITYFRIDFRDKEKHSEEYGLIQALADLRIIHMINPSLSDPHHAGRRSEVYLLDLSQYSGSRLKHNLRILDFERGHMVLKKTRSSEKKRTGDNARKLNTLLRVGPPFDLNNLSNAIQHDHDIPNA